MEESFPSLVHSPSNPTLMVKKHLTPLYPTPPTCNTITSCFFFRRFERYARAVAKTHESVHTTPFDVVTPNIVFGLDVINLVNFSGISVPKYNNFVMKKEMFDKKTKINLQKFLFDDAVSYR